LKNPTLAIVLVLGAAIPGCVASPFDIDAHDYHLHRLVVGIAFPPLQRQSDMAATISC
jgi:hypothetical protein